MAATACCGRVVASLGAPVSCILGAMLLCPNHSDSPNDVLTCVSCIGHRAPYAPHTTHHAPRIGHLSHHAPRIGHLSHHAGRIEVVGKHTDYAGGRSLLAATNISFCMVCVDRDDNNCRIFSTVRGPANANGLGGVCLLQHGAGWGCQWPVWCAFVGARVKHGGERDVF